MRESALIELAAAAMRVTIERTGKQEPNLASEAEQECLRLSKELGFEPLIDARSLVEFERRWRKQLRVFRHKDILRMGMLLARQHTFVAYLQVYPNAKNRPASCFALEQIQQTIEAQFDEYGLHESFLLMPHIPWPDAPAAWKDWSGDKLRACVIRELDSLNAPATAPSDTP